MYETKCTVIISYYTDDKVGKTKLNTRGKTVDPTAYTGVSVNNWVGQ